MVSYCDLWVSKARLEPFRADSLCALNVTARELLAQYLNTETDCCSEVTELKKDWRGLAELMGFSYNQIKTMAKGKTMKLLEEWWKENPEAVVGELLDLLEQQERTDIFADAKLHKFIARDVEKYRKNQERQKQRNWTCSDIQSTSRDSRRERKADAMIYGEWKFEEDNCITTSDRDGKPARFDAFLCYTTDNFPFVEELILRLEKGQGFKLFIPKRDLLPVGCFYAALAHVIKQRCSKMLIVVSRAYLRSDECDFMTKFAQSLSPGARNRKIIPILMESDCECPDILRHMAVMDYDNYEKFDWFWGRLSKALMISPSPSVHGTRRHGFAGEAGGMYKTKSRENIVLRTRENGWESLYPDGVCIDASAEQIVDGDGLCGLVDDLDSLHLAEPDEGQTDPDEVQQTGYQGSRFDDGYSDHSVGSSVLGDVAQCESRSKVPGSTKEEDQTSRDLEDESGIVCP